MADSPAMRETFRDCVHRPGPIGQRARRFARNRLLDLRSLLRPSPGERFLRCLYAHYVFDDQRESFEALIDALLTLGEFVSSDEAVSMARGERRIDGRYFHLSFDDGLACIARNAVPVLAARDIRAIVFVNSAVAGGAGERERTTWERATNYRRRLEVMDWDMLAGSGLEIGAHTRTHRRLSEISHDQTLLRFEIFECKSEIENNIGRSCKYFAWPFGRMTDVDSPTLRAVREAGFEAAFGGFRMTINPEKINPYMIPRHHFEPHWPLRHVLFFALGGMEKPCRLPEW